MNQNVDIHFEQPEVNNVNILDLDNNFVCNQSLRQPLYVNKTPNEFMGCQENSLIDFANELIEKECALTGIQYKVYILR